MPYTAPADKTVGSTLTHTEFNTLADALEATTTLAENAPTDADLAGKSNVGHTHTVTTISSDDGPFTTTFMPPAYEIVVVKADDLYGAAGSWPATRPGRADQYCRFVGNTDPGALALDHDTWVVTA